MLQEKTEELWNKPKNPIYITKQQTKKCIVTSKNKLHGSWVGGSTPFVQVSTAQRFWWRRAMPPWPRSAAALGRLLQWQPAPSPAAVAPPCALPVPALAIYSDTICFVPSRVLSPAGFCLQAGFFHQQGFIPSRVLSPALPESQSTRGLLSRGENATKKGNFSDENISIQLSATGQVLQPQWLITLLMTVKLNRYS